MAMFKCSGVLFNGTIVINTTANATVTATTSGTTRTFTAVANASGVANIQVKKRGTYSIVSTGTTMVGHATVSDATPVTAYYNWTKWNSNATYAQAITRSGTAVGGESSSTVTLFTGVNSNCSMYASGYSFSTANGKYTLNSPQFFDSVSVGYMFNMYSYSGTRYIVPSAGYYTYSSGTMAELSVTYNADIFHYTSNSTIVAKEEYEAGRECNMYWKIRGSSVTYSKGSTSYGTVTSPSLDTYPTNARSSSDGYWYVAA